MTRGDLIVLVPWIIFAICLAVVLIALMRGRDGRR